MDDYQNEDAERSRKAAEYLCSYWTSYGPPVPIEALSYVGNRKLRLTKDECRTLVGAGIGSTVLLFTHRNLQRLARRYDLAEVGVLTRARHVLRVYDEDPTVSGAFASYLEKHGQSAAARMHAEHAKSVRDDLTLGSSGEQRIGAHIFPE